MQATIADDIAVAAASAPWRERADDYAGAWHAPQA